MEISSRARSMAAFALLCAAAACNDGGAPAPSGDAADAGGGMPTTGAHVTVLARDVGLAPAPGVLVAVSDEAGVVLATTHTGADGKAAVVVPAGGLATLYPTGDYARGALAVMDPPDGATVAFSLFDHTKLAGRVLHLTGVPAGAAKLEVHACSAGSGPPDVFTPTPGGTSHVVLPGSCGGDVATVLVIARDEVHAPLAWGRFDGALGDPYQALSIALDHTSFADLHVTLAAPAGPVGGSLSTWLRGRVPIGLTPRGSTVIHGGEPPEPWDWTLPDVDLPLLVRMMSLPDDHHAVIHDRTWNGVPPSIGVDDSSVALVDLRITNTDPNRAEVAWKTEFEADEVSLLLLDGFDFRLVAPPRKAGSFRVPELPEEVAAEYGAARTEGGFTAAEILLLDETAADGFAHVAQLDPSASVWPDATATSDLVKR